MRSTSLVPILAGALFAAFVLPAAVTGMLLVADEPIPGGWDPVVASARTSIASHVDGIFGLRFVRLDCRPGGGVVAWFEMRGPLAPGTAAVAISERPTDPSDAGWWGGVASAVGDDPDAQVFLGANGSPC